MKTKKSVLTQTLIHTFPCFLTAKNWKQPEYSPQAAVPPPRGMLCSNKKENYSDIHRTLHLKSILLGKEGPGSGGGGRHRL